MLSPCEQGSGYGIFMAHRMVKMESEIFLGVGGFMVNSCL